MPSRKIWLFDTTLRDGEQAPGVHLTPEKKVKIAKALDEAGLDVIEAGFPANGNTELRSIRLICKEVEEAEVAVLCRPIQSEIRLCEEVLDRAQRSRLHLWIATSPIHMKHKLNMTPDEVVGKTIEAVRYASGRFDTIQFSSEDSTRSHLDFLGNMMREVVRAGADIVNLADTVGCALPEHMALMVGHIKKAVKGRVPVGVHCHNDLGLATANTLSSIRAGADQVDVTVTGIGERAGNASLEQLGVALMFHKRHMDIEMRLRPDRLGALCDTVINEMGLKVGLTQPLVGENAFRHESGIHVHGVLNNPLTYEFVDPLDFGLENTSFVIGKHTGRTAVKNALDNSGYWLREEDPVKLTDIIKEHTTVKGPFSSDSELIDFVWKNGFDLMAKGAVEGG